PGTGHEHWGARIVDENRELGALLEALEPGLAATLGEFWNKRYKPHFARKLVSSQLDVDRLDYLLRDGHYSGAGYATYDLDWIIHAVQIASVRTGHDDPSDLVVDYRRGMYAVEQYLFARSYMYAQVYHHKTVRAAADRLWPQALEVAERRFGAAARSYIHLDTARQVGYLATDDDELHVIDHPRYGAVTLSRLLEDMPLGQPMAAIRLVCAPELVDELRPLV